VREALDAALATMSRDVETPYRLDDDGRCQIRVPLPAGIVDGLAVLDVTVSLGGEIVSFVSPLAAMIGARDAGDFAVALLRRQFFGAQTDGAAFAIADREDVLVAVYHWYPVALTSEALAHVFGRFVGAVVHLHGEVVRAAGQGAPIEPFAAGG
jgi:hypothetical protein